MDKRLPIVLVVITYQEEMNIEACLLSVKDWVGEIFVVDGMSTDKTVEIAKRYTENVLQHPFSGYATQYNWALGNLSIKSEWILKLDGDERMTEELWEEIAEELSKSPAAFAGYYIKRRFYFLGRWIRHGGYYPTWLLRLWRNGKGRSEERAMDEHIILTEGEVGYLKHDFIHDDRRDLSFWIEKHNKHSTREVINRLLPGVSSTRGRLFGFQGERKRWVNENVYAHVPLFMRAFGYFLYRYFFRLGFLDGIPGLVYHFLHGFWYRFLIDAKIYELRFRNERISKSVH